MIKLTCPKHGLTDHFKLSKKRKLAECLLCQKEWKKKNSEKAYKNRRRFDILKSKRLLPGSFESNT